MVEPMAAEVSPDKLQTVGADGTNGEKSVLDLGSFVGDLTGAVGEDDDASEDISLEGLEQELQDCKDDEVVTNILSKGTKLREYTKGVESKLRQVELDSIEDYIKESDNLVSLHDQIRDCDIILSQMESLLSGFQMDEVKENLNMVSNRIETLLFLPIPWFILDLVLSEPLICSFSIITFFQAEIGSISSDIKILQEKSMDMGLKLKNRKVAESKLAKFVEDIIVPPRMVDIIVDGEVNEEYLRTLEVLSNKLKFVEVDTMVKTSKALKDVQPELERLRQKAVSKPNAVDTNENIGWWMVPFAIKS